MELGNALSGLPAVDSYIIRVYRRSDETGREVSGLVERVGNGGRQAFSNGEELWRFLTAKPTRERSGPDAPVGRGRRRRPG